MLIHIDPFQFHMYQASRGIKSIAQHFFLKCTICLHRVIKTTKLDNNNCILFVSLSNFIVTHLFKSKNTLHLNTFHFNDTALHYQAIASTIIIKVHYTIIVNELQTLPLS
jgi:hypothetical protein